MAETTAFGSPRRAPLATLVLRGAFASSLGALAALALWVPEAVPLVMLALVGLCVLVVGSVRPGVYLTAALLGAVAILGSEEGLQLMEVLYFVYLAGFLAVWYAWWFLSGAARLRSLQDTLSAGVLVLGGGGGIALGLLFGAPISGIRSDFIGFFPILLYFPVREAVASSPRGAHGVGVALLGLCLSAAMIVLWELYSTVVSATAAWEIIDVRVAGYEIPLLIGSVVALTMVAYIEDVRGKLAALLLSAFLLIILIITKSRGYWIGWALSVGLLFVSLPPRQRHTLYSWGAGGFALGGGALLVVAGDVVVAFAIGIVNRFSTLASALTSDVSLLNRYVETNALLGRVAQNPVLGHGFGTEYSYNNLIDRGQITWAYAHNGFVGLWFKIGFWGFCLVMTWWLHAAWEGFIASRSRGLSSTEQGYGIGIATALLGLLLTTYTSGIYFIDSQIFLLTVSVALAAGLRLRSRTQFPPHEG